MLILCPIDKVIIITAQIRLGNGTLVTPTTTNWSTIDSTVFILKAFLNYAVCTAVGELGRQADFICYATYNNILFKDQIVLKITRPLPIVPQPTDPVGSILIAEGDPY